jgi:nucleoside-triphosphatase
MGQREMQKKNILFTGSPGCGKSTLITKICGKIRSPVTGFLTSEIREKSTRIGFSIETLDGERGVLAHVDIESRFRVGKYGVNIEDIDRIIVPSMMPNEPNEIVVIDEIGKMECFSPLFRKTLSEVLDSNHTVIGSIALKGNRFIEGIKTRSNTHIVHLTERNRDKLADLYDWRLL